MSATQGIYNTNSTASNAKTVDTLVNYWYSKDRHDPAPEPPRKCSHFVHLWLKLNFTERSHRGLDQVFRILGIDLYCLGNCLQMPTSALSSELEAVSDPDWVDATIKKSLGLLEESSAENDNACRAVADFVVLRLGQLDHQFGNLEYSR